MTTPGSGTIVIPGLPAFGVSEIAHFLGIASSVLLTFFGKDWGLGAHVQALAPVLAVILIVSLGIFRAIKHHAAAKVQVAAINASIYQTATLVSSTPAETSGDSGAVDVNFVLLMLILICVVALLFGAHISTN